MKQLVEPKIVTKEKMVVVGMECQTSNKEMEETNVMDQLWMNFMGAHEQILHKTNPKVTYGFCYDYNEQKGGFRYLAAFEVDQVNLPNDQFISKEIPSQKYLVFTHKGPASTIGKAFNDIFNSYLPSTSYEVLNTPSFELYDERFLGPESPESVIDIYIPIK
ncbi:GyrI-like domain-containing protein [Bacillus carboniphilus]|uniref:GyrI-like domain-containing protein n=1 Tax=Bacillus carboniphilus TaxID=86663 RepID=A0ABY9JWC9_9BACI|nr:GyrI-like domain-containing protein [Bacillus carboniphilus]WLR42720.1 GyrI-like domain-containing protein [Bacillus carboniphilus]